MTVVIDRKWHGTKDKPFNMPCKAPSELVLNVLASSPTLSPKLSLQFAWNHVHYPHHPIKDLLFLTLSSAWNTQPPSLLPRSFPLVCSFYSLLPFSSSYTDLGVFFYKSTLFLDVMSYIVTTFFFFSRLWVAGGWNHLVEQQAQWVAQDRCSIKC